MNKIYRVLWNKATQTFVAVAEIVASSGKGATRSSLCSTSPSLLDAALQTLWAFMASVGLGWSASMAQGVAPTQLPVGGQVVAGTAKIAQSNSILSISQTSTRAAINWQSFDVGAQAKVNITQPSSSSVLLNRILGNSASQILGQISANGQVIVSNPSGMYFSPTAAVDVHSFTATTHGIHDADFMSGIMKYTRNGATGKVVNEGQISAGLGGYVALLAPEVRNSGVVVAQMGTVALASGEAYELQFDPQHTLTHILVSPSTVAALVDNGRAVHAPGGLIILSAQAANQLQSGVVKNSGTLQATGLINQGGVIRLSASQRIVNTGSLLADAAPNSHGDGGSITVVANLNNTNSSVDVGGTFSAQGGDLGGHGGFIETSASKVHIQDSARVITLSPKGKAGTWLVDPIDFTIDSGLGSQTSSGIGAGTLENNLANTSVSISTDNLASGSGGDLNVNASVTWSANTTLTLSAYKNVNVNAALTATGAGSGLNITAKVGGSSGAINLGANVTTGGQQLYNGNISLIGSDIGLTSTSGGISIVGGVTPSAGGSNMTIASETAGNITGALTGNTKLIKAGNGVLALKGGSNYTGGTELAGGAIRLDHASGSATSAANALGPSGLISFSGGALQFTANNTVDYSSRFNTGATQSYAFDTNGQNVTLASLPAGSGTLTKSGGGTLTVTNASTRFGNTSVGATVVNGGSLTLAVAHPSAIVSQAVFNGAGTLNIEPVSTSFNSTTTTGSDLLFSTGGGTLGGFNLGKTGNASNITLDSLSGISVLGNQGYFGGNVTLSAAATPSFTSWGNGATLTLSGINSVNIGAPISVTQANSSIAIKTSQNTGAGGNVGYYNFGLSASGFSGRIDFSGDPGQTFTTQDGTNAANLKTYTFITTLDTLRTSSASANLALRTNLDAASYLQAGGTPYTAVRDGSFTGSFAGLGHTISNLSIRGSGVSYAGLFSQIGSAVVQDLRFESANITGINMNYLGTLAGYANNAKVSGIMVANGSVNISSSGSWAGGVLGYTEGGTFQDAWVSNTSVAAISGGAGGILGRSLMTITNVHNLGSDVRSNGGEVGGLVGQHWNGQSLGLSHATGNVTGGGSYVGGLVGQNWGPISDSYATGNVTGNLTNDYAAVGGAVGRLYASSLTNVTASGNVLNRYGQIGGLIGLAEQSVTLTNVSAAGTVRSQSSSSIGGLVGYSNSVLALNNATYSGTSVVSTGSVEGVGGLIGYVQESVSIANSSVGNAGARVNISSTGAAGGLVGWARNGITITDSNVSNADISGGTYVGGLVGEQRRGSVQINRSYVGGSGNTQITGSHFVGGLIGEMTGGYITNSYYAGNITGTSNYGGIVGFMKPGAYLSNTYYNVSASLINGNATLTMGGLYGGQFSDWVSSNPANVTARALNISNYFDSDAAGYYTINTSNAIGSRNDLGNLMGFAQGASNGDANSYKFKLTSNLDTSTASTKFIPYFAAAEFKGDGFQVNNFSWNAPTSNVGFLGFVHKSTVNGLQVYSVPFENTGNFNAINGQYYVGTAMGSMYAGVLYDSSAVLGGTTKGLDNTGGFIGYFANGSMGNVSATRLASVTDASKAQVIGTMSYSVDGDQWQDLRGNTGGVAGYLGSSSINQLNSNVDVAGGGYRTGGLLGYLSVANYSHASVTANAANNLSASGNVTSTGQQTGGLIGRASGSATTSSNWTASGNVTATDYLGGLVGNLTSGTFSHLSSTMANVTSTNSGGSAGGLVGYMSAVTLSNSSAMAHVSGTGANTGGLVGNLDGTNTLTNVSASGNVSTTSYYVGGLVGGLNGSSIIRNARYVGQSVTGVSHVGGLIGWANSVTAEVYGSYASTNVTASGDYVGGLLGFFEGKVGDSSTASASAYGSANNHSYAIGNVTGRYDVGGLVGRLGSNAQVVNSYAGVNITADANFGGLIGHFSPGVEVTNSHYNIAGNTVTAYTPSSPTSRVVLNETNGLLTIGGLYGAQYTTWFNGGQLDGLNSGGANPASAYFGAPDANGYYRIGTVQNVKDYLGFADQSTLKFRLDANLDLVSNPGLHIPYVAGELKGDGKAISNLYLSQQTSNLGFVGHLRNNSTQAAAGVELTDVTVSGSINGVMNLGLVAGSDWQRNMSNVSSSGAVAGRDIYYADKMAPAFDDRGDNNNGWSNVGGVLGYGWGRDTGSVNNLRLNNVTSSAAVTGVNAVGGMAGNLQYATVTNTTTSGTVTSVEQTNVAVYRTGGLVGLLNKTNSLLYGSGHTQGLVKGVAYVGGLVGEMQGYFGESVVNATPTYNTFVSSNVEGKSERVGGLVGYLSWGAMTNAQMSGAVTGWTISGVAGYAGTYTGGVGGYISGSMSYLRNTGLMVKAGHQSGGLVGSLSGTIDNSYSTADVVSSSSYVGGLVGNTGNWVRNSYATGSVSGTDTVGGLAGYADWVSDSYARGNVSGNGVVGGFVGNLHQASNSYATGNVSGSGSNFGGFVGFARSSITNSWSSGNVSTSNGNAIGGFVGYLQGGTWNNVSAASNVTSNNSSFVGGFVGQNAGGSINNATSSGYVYGADNTNLNYVGGFAGLNQATINNASANITVTHPVSQVGVRGTQRVGGFVGDNTGTIVNATSSATVSGRSDYVGGFVGWMEGGLINQSGSSGEVTGPYSVGGFVGYQNAGTIQRSFANSLTSAGDAQLTASGSKVGGFIGSMENGTITSSRAAGAATGLGKVGGFVGYINNSSTINTSYATGAVTQTSTSSAGTTGAAGGFAGYLNANFVGSISDFYAMGAVTGTQNVGGLIGFADRGTVSGGYATGMTTFNSASTPTPANIGGVWGKLNSVAGCVTASNLYWNTETSNLTVSGGLGTGLTTTQFKGTLSNTAGFNASNANWNTSAGMFPYLQVFYPTQPRALEGFAYLSDGGVAKRAQVGQYTGGILLNGGTASTGVNGYFYSIVGSNTLFVDAAIPEGIDTVTVDPNNRGNGYNNPPTVSLVGGGGTGATATASRINPQNNTTTASIYSVNVTNAGTGYTSAPRVVLSSADANPTSPVLNVTLKVPEFNTTQLATLLMLDGNVTVNSTVAGMAYTDRILLNDTNAFIYKDGNTNVMERLVQGITRLSTQNSSATLMNQDMGATMGVTKQSSVAASLPTISSLELFSRAGAFNLDTPLSYADNGVMNAGNITVTGNANVTLSGGTIVSSRAQNYNAVLSLGADASLNATTVTTQSTLAGGGFNLTINAVTAAGSGNLVTGGDFSGLNHFGVARNSTLNGHVSSSGNQTYNGLVSLGLDILLTGSNVTLASGATLSGAGHSLDVVGNANVGGDVSNVSTVNVSGTTRLSANVSSTGDQTYVGAITLSGDSSLQASGLNAVITAGGTVNGAQALTMNATGTGGRVVLNGAVGDSATLTHLSANATAITMNAGSVRTAVSQSYAGPITLAKDTVLTSTGSGGSITVADAINGDVAASRALSISNTGGTTTLGSSLGNLNRLSAVDLVGGAVVLNGATVNTSGNQSYAGSMTLGANTTLTGAHVAVSNGANLSATGHSLDVVGNASWGGDLSNISTVNVSGTTRLSANVSSTGDQTYIGAMTLSGDTRLQASGANAVINVGGTVNGAQALAMNAVGAGGRLVLNGAVGDNTPLTRLSANASAITLNGGSVSTSGDQRYEGAVTLGANLTLSSTAAHGTLSFGGTVDSDGSARSLSIGSGYGDTVVQLGGSVGGARALTHFTSAAASTLIGNASSGLPVTLKTLDSLQLSNAVQLQAPVHFNVTQQGGIHGPVSGSFDLIKDGTGTLLLSQANSYTGRTWVNAGTLAIANAQGLGAGTSTVSVSHDALLDLQGVAVMGHDLSLQGGTVRASQGSSSWSGPVSLGADSRLDVTGTQFNISGMVDSGPIGYGLALSGQGAVALNNPANALRRVASAGTVSSIELQNASPLSVGSVTVGPTTYLGLQSAGQITLANSAAVTIAPGASVASTGGDVVLETSRFINQAGASAVSTPASNRWQVWSTNPAPFDATSGDSPNSLNNDYVQYNVSRGGAPAVPGGHGLLFSYAPVAVASLTGTVSRTYDGTTTAPLQPSNYDVSGAVNQDVLTMSTPSVGHYVTSGTAATVQGAGSNKDVQVTGLVLTAQQAGKPVYGYTFSNTVTGTVGEIQPRSLDLIFTKVYDGNNVFDHRHPYAASGLVGQDLLPRIASGSAVVNSANAGVYSRFSSSSIALDDPNYTLVGGTQQATIQKAPLGIAINTQFKGKTDLSDVAARDFTVVGLQNGEVIPKLDLVTLLYKDVSRNNDNYVKTLVVSAGPGVADMANYMITQAVNRVSKVSEGGNTMNMVKLTSPDEVVTTPVPPRPYLPEITKPINAPSLPAPAQGGAASSSLTTPVTAATAATAATSSQPPVVSTSTPGIIVNTVTAPTSQASGLVTVILPREMSNVAVTGLVIALPQAVVAAPSTSTGDGPGLSVTLSNNQPLPDWIRYDASQQALVTTPDARASFPITVVITVGDQQTVVVVSESLQN